MARAIPMGAQATVAVETLDILRWHGWYDLILRKDFMAAADLLCRVTGINRRAWPLSVHELSVAVFYALAQQRGRRGGDPEREHRLHILRVVEGGRDKGRGEGDGVVVTCGAERVDVAGVPLIPSDEGGDEVLWGGGDGTGAGATAVGNMAIDETDRFDPMAESVVISLTDITDDEILYSCLTQFISYDMLGGFVMHFLML